MRGPLRCDTHHAAEISALCLMKLKWPRELANAARGPAPTQRRPRIDAILRAAPRADASDLSPVTVHPGSEIAPAVGGAEPID